MSTEAIDDSGGAEVEEVGWRKLRRGLGGYLRSAGQGSEYVLTIRGVPTARLVPLRNEPYEVPKAKT